MSQKLSTILYVEDEPEVRSELTRFLQRLSHEVITAENGEEGWALYRSHTPDIVITDIKMPITSGIELAKKIKETSPNQSIIFTSAHSDNGYFIEAINLQVDGYIFKPVDLGLLKQKVYDIYKNIQIKKEKELYSAILDDVAQMQDTMLAVYNEQGAPIFFNQKLLSFLGHESLTDFAKKHQSLSQQFEPKEGCFFTQNKNGQWIEALRAKAPDQRMVSMWDSALSQSRFFLLSLSGKTSHSNTIITFSEVTSMVREKDQYRHDAHTDTLTQIDNRTRFNIIFEKAIAQSREERSPLSILLLDIDHFKRINDRHGHTIGDSVLQEFSRLIQSNIRSSDSFSRWGGEEFVLLLRATTLNDAKALAENLRSRIEKHDFDIGETLTSSFGVTVLRNNDTSKSLFSRVDQALYDAKRNGRNCVSAQA